MPAYIGNTGLVSHGLRKRLNIGIRDRNTRRHIDRILIQSSISDGGAMPNGRGACGKAVDTELRFSHAKRPPALIHPNNFKCRQPLPLHVSGFESAACLHQLTKIAGNSHNIS